MHNTSDNIIIVISYHYRPSQSIAATRLSKLCKYLSRLGWQPIVITADNDPRESEHLEPNVYKIKYHQLRVTNREKKGPTKARRISASGRSLIGKMVTIGKSFIASVVSLPLIRTVAEEPFWYFGALKRAMSLLKNTGAQIVFSSYGPAASHLVASRLKSKGVYWVAEYRDLWSQNPYVRKAQPFTYLEKKWEQRIIRNCDQIVAISEPMARDLQVLHKKNVSVVTSGFDPEDYPLHKRKSNKFIITYTGSVYKGKRDPTALFQAVHKLYQEGQIDPNSFEIRFIGNESLSYVKNLLKSYQIEKMVSFHEMISYAESISAQSESTVLLLLSWNNPSDAGTYSGKVFEYLGAGRPILACSIFPQGSIQRLLVDTGCGIIANEVDEIFKILSVWLHEFFDDGVIRSYYNPKQDIIESYSWASQALNLSKVLQRYKSVTGNTIIHQNQRNHE
ncbi:Glycosyltransferase involved in cell wall bisynthesis [Dehalogenimonas formicexedens]|uniref:Glycosyltransferase involved in cell wall bisynthesis n=1 Tax=Dehalogenimonas formicexedens TaxID=1839801 RepID=A0A1P8F9M9_9CHLR|nr:glycosyltransferase [Dehalogenimonas formicexedens]APV45148.1 Glycosyltransferase involved in cell wall bisynthesis [Dehalogenimonas formicexedens]